MQNARRRLASNSRMLADSCGHTAPLDNKNIVNRIERALKDHTVQDEDDKTKCYIISLIDHFRISFHSYYCLDGFQAYYRGTEKSCLSCAMRRSKARLNPSGDYSTADHEHVVTQDLM